MKKIAINGFGRIGRLAFRIINEKYHDLDIVAINDLSSPEDLAYLLKYDTVYGRYRVPEVSFDESSISVGDKQIAVFAEADPEKLPWKEMGIDLVLECTGAFTKESGARKHINAGAKKVLISAPAKEGNVKTIVFNANDEILDGSEEVVSAASCTTNCLAPVLKILDDFIGIEKGLMTTVHAVTTTQSILDSPSKNIKQRRGRAATFNIIPTSTGAASAIGKVLPNLDKKLDGMALRVPVMTGSIIDLTLELKRNTTVDEINSLFKNNTSESTFYTEDPIVSSDIIGSTAGAIVDALSTSIVSDSSDKQLVKVLAWYDNESSFTNQMIRTARRMLSL